MQLSGCLWILSFIVLHPLSARAQLRLDQDSSLRGLRSVGIITSFELRKAAESVIDSVDVGRSLRTIIELEARRNGIALPPPPQCPQAKCPLGFGLVFVRILVMEPEGELVVASYNLEVKQQGMLQNGYADFFTTWSSGGVLWVRPERTTVAKGLQEGIMSAVRDFLNAHSKVNPR
jgi:hypothetical protein